MRNIEPAELVQFVRKMGFNARLAQHTGAVQSIPAGRRHDFYAGVGVAVNFAWEQANTTGREVLEAYLARVADLLVEEQGGADAEQEIKVILATVRDQGMSSHNARTRAAILAVIPRTRAETTTVGWPSGFTLPAGTWRTLSSSWCSRFT